MAGDLRTERGYLVLADISGYTAFFAGTELEHAAGIVDDLSRCVMDRLSPPLRIVKLEGDAVFVYAPDDLFAHGERVLELVESCYVAFTDQLADIVRMTTCRCAACANVGMLDLKFVVHFGEFVVQQTPGGEDVAGTDVIIVHRLLKNRAVETTGVHAYALLTYAFARRLRGDPALPSYDEHLVTIGDVRVLVEDLAPVAQHQRAARRIVVEPDEADVDVEIHLHAPPQVAWDWWTTPELMRRFEPGLTGAEARPNARGRSGIGAELHCAHGSGFVVNRMVDWKPFDYYTQDCEPLKSSRTTPPACRATWEFRPGEDGATALRVRVRLTSRGPLTRVMMPVIRRAYGRFLREAEHRFNELITSGAVPDT